MWVPQSIFVILIFVIPKITHRIYSPHLLTRIYSPCDGVKNSTERFGLRLHHHSLYCRRLLPSKLNEVLSSEGDGRTINQLNRQKAVPLKESRYARIFKTENSYRSLSEQLGFISWNPLKPNAKFKRQRLTWSRQIGTNSRWSLIFKSWMMATLSMAGRDWLLRRQKEDRRQTHRLDFLW